MPFGKMVKEQKKMSKFKKTPNKQTYTHICNTSTVLRTKLYTTTNLKHRNSYLITFTQFSTPRDGQRNVDKLVDRFHLVR